MILCLGLILTAIAYRVALPHLDGFSNFAPLMAIAFCGALYLPRRWALAIPVLALFLSDLILNTYYGVALFSPFMLFTTTCYVLAALLGRWVAGRKNWLNLLGGCLGCSILFYLVSNTAAFFLNPVYAKTLAGWIQALTVGEPGYPATILFLRNSLLSDLGFTLLFIVCMEWSAARAGLSQLLPTIGEGAKSSKPAQA